MTYTIHERYEEIGLSKRIKLSVRASVGLAVAALAATALPPAYSQALTRTTAVTSDSTITCSDPGSWLDVQTGKRLARSALFDELASKPLVLLGETHDNAEHHRWQLNTLAALHSRADRLVIGFEMFPRRLQSVLDQWVAGKLSEKAFLKSVDWRRTWGYAPNLYMPLFHFARMHRVPMVALNVERQLVSRVGAEGWDAVPTHEREGLSDPASPSPAYLRSLAQVYADKMKMTADGPKDGTSSLSKGSDAGRRAEIDGILKLPAFKLFVAAQLTWDRAMAEGLAKAKHANPSALVVGVMGSGHLSYFHGVPHQLADMGFSESKVLIPVDTQSACELVGNNYADAVFVVEPRSATTSPATRPILRVQLSDESRAAVVSRVLPDSVAKSADLRKGDRIVRAAGLNVESSAALIDIIARQAPGTWLPLTIERAGKTVELVARFPAARRKESP